MSYTMGNLHLVEKHLENARKATPAMFDPSWIYKQTTLGPTGPSRPFVRVTTRIELELTMYLHSHGQHIVAASIVGKLTREDGFQFVNDALEQIVDPTPLIVVVEGLIVGQASRTNEGSFSLAAYEIARDLATFHGLRPNEVRPTPSRASDLPKVPGRAGRRVQMWLPWRRR